MIANTIVGPFSYGQEPTYCCRLFYAILVLTTNLTAPTNQPQLTSMFPSPPTECSASGGFISFELITGYVLSAAAESMLMQPGTLQLTDCLNICRQNSSCLAINFETGLCVLLQESADKNPQALQKSQFPVFTIYAHKICIQGELIIIIIIINTTSTPTFLFV